MTLALDSESLKKALDDIPEAYKNLLVRNNRDLMKEMVVNVNKQVNDSDKLCPKPELIYNAFKKTKKIKVVIIGQDPYHNRSDACGLAFSVPKDRPIPGSLKNIYMCLLHNELINDMPTHGCLDKWAEQGVLLLNAALTTSIGQRNAHTFWHKYTDKIISDISDTYSNIIFILWGRFAEQKKELINKTKHTILTWGHPSNMNPVNNSDDNNKNFKYCNNFVRCNQMLKLAGENTINWNPDADLIIEDTNEEIAEDYDGDNEAQLDNEAPEDNEEQLDNEEQVDDEVPEEQVDNEELEEQVDDEAPEEQVDDEVPEEQVDNEEQVDDEVPEEISIRELWIATDGASKSNGKPNCTASYGYAIKFDDDEDMAKEGNGIVPLVKLPGKKYKTSNNRGELMGVIEALKAVNEIEHENYINIITDSAYTIGTFPKYVIKHGIEATNVVKENRDLIKELTSLFDILNENGCEIHSYHIHSHKEAPEDIESTEYFQWWMNDYVDTLATEAL